MAYVALSCSLEVAAWVGLAGHKPTRTPHQSYKETGPHPRPLFLGNCARSISNPAEAPMSNFSYHPKVVLVPLASPPFQNPCEENLLCDGLNFEEFARTDVKPAQGPFLRTGILNCTRSVAPFSQAISSFVRPFQCSACFSQSATIAIGEEPSGHQTGRARVCSHPKE
jgi:hypothetical protein